MSQEGIKFTVTSTEVREHLVAKARYHDDRAAFYGAQKAALREVGDGLSVRLPEALAKYSNRHGHADPLKVIDEIREKHVERGGHARFLAEHVKPDQVFELSGYDVREFAFGVDFAKSEERLLGENM